MEWVNSSWVTAILASALTGGASILVAWIQLSKMGVNASNVAEITDRATFRADMFQQIKHLGERLAIIEKLEQECQAERIRLLSVNVKLEFRVSQLESMVNGTKP